MKHFYVFSINYDTDGEVIEELPVELFVSFDIDDVPVDELDDMISDEITNRTGFCHKGFEFRQLF